MRINDSTNLRLHAAYTNKYQNACFCVSIFADRLCLNPVPKCIQQHISSCTVFHGKLVVKSLL